jgi:hypothetical protein
MQGKNGAVHNLSFATVSADLSGMVRLGAAGWDRHRGCFYAAVQHIGRAL